MKSARMGILAGALVLTGCSGEPSESDMIQAINAHDRFRLTIVATLMARGVAEADAKTIFRENSRIEKSGCVQAQGMPGFVCDFRWGLKQPDGSVNFLNPAKGRFFKSGNGWAAEL
jgi:hypothetical protein